MPLPAAWGSVALGGVLAASAETPCSDSKVAVVACTLDSLVRISVVVCMGFASFTSRHVKVFSQNV